MLYEIGDPSSYILPDVICDFSNVKITQAGDNRVHLSPAIGYMPPNTYKTCLTYKDGFRAGTYLTIYGGNATAKAKKLAEAALTRAKKTLRLFNLGNYTEVSQEILGSGSQFGEARASDEVVMKLAVKHPEAKAVGIFLKELAGIGLATPPGLSGFTGGGRARPSPVVRLFSYKTDKTDVKVRVDVDGKIYEHQDNTSESSEKSKNSIVEPKIIMDAETEVPLIKLAWGRSGDKGDKANIGIIARKAEYLPYIWAALTADKIGTVYQHFTDNPKAIERFYLPGSHAINILIDNILGGGGAASLRNDAQAKGYAQILLAQPIAVSKAIAKSL